MRGKKYPNTEKHLHFVISTQIVSNLSIQKLIEKTKISQHY